MASGTELGKYSEWQPNYTARLSVDVEQPPIHYPTAHGVALVITPGNRKRVVIEGEVAFVDRLLVLMRDEMNAIAGEINGA